MPSSGLIGTWLLQSFEKRDAAGAWQPWPQGAHGYLIYAASGHMSVAINWPPDASGDFCDAYAGTWTLTGDRMQHRVTNSVRPKRIGKTLTRRITLSGNRLTIHAETKDGQLRLVWQKADDQHD